MRTELLEVGARLMVGESYGWHGRRHKPGTVTRRTPKGIVTVTIDAYPPHGTIAHEVTFNPDGNERGNRYNGRTLQPFDQEILRTVKYTTPQSAKKRRELESDFNSGWMQTFRHDLIERVLRGCRKNQRIKDGGERCQMKWSALTAVTSSQEA